MSAPQEEADNDYVPSHKELRRQLQMKENMIQTNLGVLSVITVVLIAAYMVMIFENDQSTAEKQHGKENYSVSELQTDVETLLNLNETLRDLIQNREANEYSSQENLEELRTNQNDLKHFLSKIENISSLIKIRGEHQLDHLWHLFNHDKEKSILWLNLTNNVKGIIKEYQGSLNTADKPGVLTSEIENLIGKMNQTLNFLKSVDQREEIFFKKEIRAIIQDFNKEKIKLLWRQGVAKPLQTNTTGGQRKRQENQTIELIEFELWVKSLKEKKTSNDNSDLPPIAYPLIKNETSESFLTLEEEKFEAIEKDFVSKLEEINSHIITCHNTYKDQIKVLDISLHELIPEFSQYSDYLKTLRERLEKAMINSFKEEL